MKILSLSENKNVEKRVAITPEIAKKYITSGFEVFLPKGYAVHLGFDDEEYKETINKIKQAQYDLSLLERDWIDLEEKTLENNK